MLFAKQYGDEYDARKIAFRLLCVNPGIDLLRYFKKKTANRNQSISQKKKQSKARKLDGANRKGIYFLLAKDGKKPSTAEGWEQFWSAMLIALKEEEVNVLKRIHVTAMVELFLGKTIYVSLTDKVSSIVDKCVGIRESFDGSVEILLKSGGRYGFIPRELKGDTYFGLIAKNTPETREISLDH